MTCSVTFNSCMLVAWLLMLSLNCWKATNWTHKWLGRSVWQASNFEIAGPSPQNVYQIDAFTDSYCSTLDFHGMRFALWIEKQLTWTGPFDKGLTLNCRSITSNVDRTDAVTTQRQRTALLHAEMMSCVAHSTCCLTTTWKPWHQGCVSCPEQAKE